MSEERDYEREEIEHLHERMNWPRMVQLLTEMELSYGKPNTNNWKLAHRYGLQIYELAAIRHWLFESHVRLKGKVKRILRARIRQISKT